MTSLARVCHCQHIPGWSHSSSQVVSEVRIVLLLDKETEAQLLLPDRWGKAEAGPRCRAGMSTHEFSSPRPSEHLPLLPPSAMCSLSVVSFSSLKKTSLFFFLSDFFHLILGREKVSCLPVESPVEMWDYFKKKGRDHIDWHHPFTIISGFLPLNTTPFLLFEEHIFEHECWPRE